MEILVSAGIIESIIKPTLQDIFQLAALVVIRTIISYFLNKEIGPVDVQNK
ncbi:membrane protein [Enterococcus faecium]|nr:membrane protein [Enterococcus faecium]MBK4839083.1 membrane protein [Enterococcus faecium]MBK4847691.1 membrane protein [Enterococcus faecium]MBK4850320.1 membrane protein [Enterococcus faecium]